LLLILVSKLEGSIFIVFPTEISFLIGSVLQQKKNIKINKNLNKFIKPPF
tara:strand:- start:495 stop:644 length:150 start_codon:yes stop_codon:yes gene_type:complete